MILSPRLSIIIVFFLLGCSETKQVKSPNRLEMATDYSVQKSGEALLIWVDGELLLEDYQGDSSPDKRYSVAEVSTLLSGLMAVAAVEDGLFTLDEPVSNTITEWKNDTKKSTITISRLLHLTSGINGPNGSSYPTVRESIASPLVRPPGEQFAYNPLPYQIFGILIQRKTGMDYLREKILKPLDIKGGYWTIAQENSQYDLDITMVPRIFDGANLTAAELGRIGQFLLQEGHWRGENIIEDLSPLFQPTDASSGYGLGVWLNKDVSMDSDSVFLQNLPENIMLLRGYNNKKLIYDEAPSDLYMAAGRFNQRLYVIPSRKMVIVRLGRSNLTWSDAEFLARLLHGKHIVNCPARNTK